MNEQTLKKMKQMKLHGMARFFHTSLESGKAGGYTADELLSILIESQWDERYNRKLERTIKEARFRYKASVEQISFDVTRQVEKNQILRIAGCDFVNKKENVFVTGSTGVGKSFIASALGYEACSLGYKVLYQQSAKLFARMKMAKVDGTYQKEIARIEKQDLLIIDDFGIQPLETQNRAILMEIIEDRHGRASTMVTSQIPVNKWYEIIGEQTVADAILGRIVHNAHRLELKGESMRKNGVKLQTETLEN